MNDISLLWTLIFVLSLAQEYRTATLDEARAVTCLSKVRISAIVESYIDPEIALLFSEQYVYHFNPKTETLEDVDEISEVFSGVLEKIEAAFKSNIYDFYYLYSVNYVYHWNRTTQLTEKHSYNYHIKFMEEWSRVFLEQYPTCATTYCDKNKNCFFVIVLPTKPLNCTYISGSAKEMGCKMASETITYPDGSSPDGLILSQCEGIMVKENLTGSHQFGVVFADHQKLVLWAGEKLVFESTYDELFECSLDLATIILIIFAVIAAVVIVGSVAIIFGRRYFRTRPVPREFRSSTTKGSKAWITREKSGYRLSSK